MTSRGYTVAAKCTIWASNLLHVAEVYRQLEEIQGIHIPICLGSIDQPNVLDDNCVQFAHMMFLSWGGQRISLHAELLKEPHVMGQAVEAMRAIHQLEALHRDSIPRNILWSEEVKHIIFINFERSEIEEALLKRPPMLHSANERRKRNVEGDLMDWKNETRLNLNGEAEKYDEVGSDALKFQILDEGHI